MYNLFCSLLIGFLYDKFAKNNLIAVSSVLLVTAFIVYTVIVGNLQDEAQNLNSNEFFIASCMTGLLVGLLGNVLW